MTVQRFKDKSQPEVTRNTSKRFSSVGTPMLIFQVGHGVGGTAAGIPEYAKLFVNLIHLLLAQVLNTATVKPMISHIIMFCSLSLLWHHFCPSCQVSKITAGFLAMARATTICQTHCMQIPMA